MLLPRYIFTVFPVQLVGFLSRLSGIFFIGPQSSKELHRTLSLCWGSLRFASPLSPHGWSGKFHLEILFPTVSQDVQLKAANCGMT